MVQIKWKTLDDKEKTRLILVDILGCTEVDGIYGYHGRAVDPYPTCAYHDDLGAWYLRTEDDTKEFDPLYNMNDAWMLATRYDVMDLQMYEPKEPKRYRLRLCKGKECAQAIAETAQEAICITALMLAGCKVEEE